MGAGLVPTDAMKIGEAVYVPIERAIRRNGSDHRLEPKQAGVLDLLTQNPGEVVSRDTLLDSVWGEDGSDEALTQTISRLRQSLGDRALIRTEPRQGYRLIVQPSLLTVEPPAMSSTDLRDSARSRFDTRALKTAFGLGLATGLLVSLVAALVLWPTPVTITEEITMPVVGPPVTERTHCEGTPAECAAALKPYSDPSG